MDGSVVFLSVFIRVHLWLTLSFWQACFSSFTRSVVHEADHETRERHENGAAKKRGTEKSEAEK
jgi:hypothetical protein